VPARDSSIVPLEILGWRGLRDGDLSAPAFEASLGADPGALVKRTSRKSVRRVPVVPAFALTCYALPRGPLRWLRRSRALRAFRAAEGLRSLGIPAARPLFAARNGREERLGVEWIEGARTLAEAARSGALPPSLPQAVAGLIARAHAAGVRLRDLKAENLLLAPDGRIVLVDFDGVMPLRRREKAADDLSRLSASFEPGGPVSERERLRFLVRYFRAREALGRAVADRAAFARRVVRRTEERRRRWARRAQQTG
jgi:tRNA A-37 threonylcarbamoyl transferase component Bud32